MHAIVGYELAQLNIATMREPMESPGMADFVANIERINALADDAPGFVWRLQTDAGDATALRPMGADRLVNISTWRDIDSLSHFVYKSAHLEIMRRRKEWFERMHEAFMVLWWVPTGHRPSIEEASERLALLRTAGPTVAAFTFRHVFPSPDAPGASAALPSPVRLATQAELPQLHSLMNESIRELVGAVLDEPATRASFEFMGLDTQLIEDGTYFVVELDGQIAGCGGWSRRATLFGGDHTAGRSARLLDPSTEPARIRAMYTHPKFARRGVGRTVLAHCEAAAARAGFRELELMATVAGEPLYRACGFELIERVLVPTSTGVQVPCARMGKTLDVR